MSENNLNKETPSSTLIKNNIKTPPTPEDQQPKNTPKHKSKKGRIKRLISGVAPQLAHALGGPLAGSAVQHISKALFGNEDAGEEAIDIAIAHASPEQLLALKVADFEFQKILSDTALEQSRIAASDRANARQHQQITKDRTQSIIGALVIIGFFVVLGVMVAKKLPEGAETEFSIMLGALATMTAAVVNYFFGSSAGSKEKTKLMSAMGQSTESME